MRAGIPMVPMPRVTYAAAPPDAVQTVDEGREEARRVDGLIQNLDRDLSAMCVARKHEIIALPRGHRKHVRDCARAAR